MTPVVGCLVLVLVCLAIPALVVAAGDVHLAVGQGIHDSSCWMSRFSLGLPCHTCTCGGRWRWSWSCYFLPSRSHCPWCPWYHHFCIWLDYLWGCHFLPCSTWTLP